MNKYRIVVLGAFFYDISAPDVVAALKTFRTLHGGRTDISSVSLFEQNTKSHKEDFVCLYRKTADGKIIKESVLS